MLAIILLTAIALVHVVVLVACLSRDPYDVRFGRKA